MYSLNSTSLVSNQPITAMRAMQLNISATNWQRMSLAEWNNMTPANTHWCKHSRHIATIWNILVANNSVLTALRNSKIENNGWTFSHNIIINRFYVKLKKTWQRLDDKCYKNITLLIYLIFMQYMKHRMQITLERSKYDLTTNSSKFMQQTTSSLFEGDTSVCN